ncbi:mandelate racemase/muconate lactonizing enzyme family protein [Cerasicoccus frondis]|uniref:mandelate racemase/muconate lactonizing enzyme family protein n=1 Tax=Cerasicoccus frondis TaxID=490090 RepID=UPI002852D546|nr:mandelate racemase/muconate lactonizing enzyme family protein [Cerasicoccus frondis]
MAQIISIEAFHLSVPLGRPLRLGEMQIRDREYVFVRLTDDAGNVGCALGHARGAPVAEVVHRCVAPFWQNAEPQAHEAIYAKCVKANVCLGTHGLFWRALSLVDCAFYDLQSRAAGMGLGQYLGGQSRNVPTVIVGGYPVADETPQSLQRQMELFQEFQPLGVKIASSADLGKDTARLRACREVLPDATPLMIDCYWSFDSAQEVLKTASTWTDLNMGWIEDPLAFDDYDGVRLLADGLDFPLAIGDEQSGLRAFERLLRAGVSVLRLDATVCGGVSAFVKIAQRAAELGVPVATHIFHPLHKQLADACPSVAWLETMLPESDIEAFHHLAPDAHHWRDGRLVAADSILGAGSEWDFDAVEHFKKPQASYVS